MTDSATMKRQVRVPAFGAPHVFVLVLVEGEPAAALHRIRQTGTVIGRGDDVGFKIDDPEVSNRHCLVRADGPICALHDLQSLNGTLLNGNRMRPGSTQRLRHLDEVQIGSTRLLFLGGRFKPSRPDKS